MSNIEEKAEIFFQKALDKLDKQDGKEKYKQIAKYGYYPNNFAKNNRKKLEDCKNNKDYKVEKVKYDFYGEKRYLFIKIKIDSTHLYINYAYEFKEGEPKSYVELPPIEQYSRPLKDIIFKEEF